MKLTFLGATGTVTGSKYLLESQGRKVMVDCGLFQGLKELRLRNWDTLPVRPQDVDPVLLTHAHLDHSGYLPRLVAQGFKGPVYCSQATADLCRILLLDSAHLQEEDAARANRYGYTKHHPALPLYTREDALEALGLLRPVNFGQVYRIDGDMAFTLYRAGHILGASFIRVQQDDGTSVLFSGDIGRPDDPVMKPPAKIQNAEYLVVESTYGDRLHDKTDPADELERIVRQTIARGGTLVIPAFAVGRAQLLMYYLYRLKSEGRIPASLPVFLDSPMAIDVTGLLQKHGNDHRLPAHLCHDVCHIATYTHTVAESKAINALNNNFPKVIVSASGMATGGRVLHHLTHYLGDDRNTVLLAGFQAAGTRGNRLARGEKEIKIHGRMWPVHARIELMASLSAHADYGEMLAWLGNFTSPPRKVFITHGEPEAARALQGHIHGRFGWTCEIPTYAQSVEV